MTTSEYILLHRNDDVRQLALNAPKDSETDIKHALEQIAGWQAARRKLPAWAATEGIIYPPHISMEQCSSEKTALYKAELALRLAGETDNTDCGKDNSAMLTDLTGGFGVDFSYMAKALNERMKGSGRRMVYVEQQEHLCSLARHNFALLGLTDAEIVNGDGVTHLQETGYSEIIYLDPARRDVQGAKTFAISDCTPNVITINKLLLERAGHVIIKLSPMLDWHKAMDDIRGVREVHIISVGNECKELLLVLGAQSDMERTAVVCVNDGEVTRFDMRENAATAAVRYVSDIKEMTERLNYLYEPNASIMKSGCFTQLAAIYNVAKLSRNSHLFMSEEQESTFPGRKFRVRKVTTMAKKELKEAIRGMTKANITVRNFPLSVAELRKRLKLKEGGSDYIFATTLADNTHVLIICDKA